MMMTSTRIFRKSYLILFRKASKLLAKVGITLLEVTLRELTLLEAESGSVKVWEWIHLLTLWLSMSTIMWKLWRWFE
jgi:hypothetical protein